MEMPDKLSSALTEFFSGNPELLEMGRNGDVQNLRHAVNMMAEVEKQKKSPLLQGNSPARASPLGRVAQSLLSPQTPSADDSMCSLPEKDFISNSDEIPLNEIECEVETLLVHNMRDNLKASNSIVDGFNARKYGKKCGYSEIYNYHVNKELYSSTANDNSQASSSTSGSSAGPSTSANAQGSASTSTMMETGAEQKLPLGLMAQLRLQRLRKINRSRPKAEVEVSEMTYNESMVRSYPGTENRTQEQQEKRRKNCLAAQVSRQKKKDHEVKLNRNSLTAFNFGISLKRQLAAMNVYAAKLIECSSGSTFDFRVESEENLLKLAAEDPDWSIANMSSP